MTNGWIDIKNTDMMLIMGGNPVSLLETNFGIPKSLIDQLPKRDGGILAKKA